MSRLRAAAAAVDLQPVVGARLSGFGARLEPSTGQHDALLARLLLLDDGRARLLWISCDLIGFSPEDDARLRASAAEKLSMPAGQVLVSCTHTHSGPGSMPFRGPPGQVDEAWLAGAFSAIASPAAALVPRLRPARLAYATETVTGLGYNRQDGTSPIDQRLLVAQLSNDDGKVIATILNYATHPVVLGERNLLFSADYPGYATRLVEQTFGGVALFVQGSAGDVDPVVYRDRGRDAGTFEVAEEMGQKLATAAERAMAHATPRPHAHLATAEQHVQLPLDPPPSRDELAALKNQLLTRLGPTGTIPSSKDGRWAMFELFWAEELERALARDAVPRSLSVRMTAARVGDLYAVSFPLEIYSQIGLDVREQLQPRAVIIAAYTGGLIGYAPTDRAIDQGGYGPAASHRFFPHLLTPLTRGSDAALVGAATELVRTLDSH